MTSPTLNVRVVRKAAEAVDIATFELVAADGSALPPFSAGAHIDVHLPNGLVRQYSLCNDPAETHRYLIGVLRDPASRGGSQAMHDQVRDGDLLRISAPKNHFPLAHEARRSLLLAGGIGITPILCMAERLALTGAEFTLHYCARTPERTAFRERIRRSAYAPRVHFHFDDGAPAQKLDLDATLARPEDGVHLYVCGPKGFIDAVLSPPPAPGAGRKRSCTTSSSPPSPRPRPAMAASRSSSPAPGASSTWPRSRPCSQPSPPPEWKSSLPANKACAAPA